MDGFIGEVRVFGFNYSPQYWAYATGQAMQVSQSQALFAVFGSNFGPNPTQTSFLLPDCRGRAPIGVGQVAGLSQVFIGAKNGASTASVNVSQIPPHSHVMNGCADLATLVTPDTTSYPAFVNISQTQSWTTYLPPPTPLPQTIMANTTLGGSGGGNVHGNNQPYLPMNFCVCIDGTYPVPAQ